MQNRFNFGKGVLSIFLTKIMAAIIDFNGSGRLGREINLYQGGGGRGGNNTAFHSPAPCPHHPLRLQIKHGQSDKQS